MQKFYAEVSEWTKEKFNNEFAYVAPTDFLTDNRDNPVVDFIDPNKIMPMCGAGKYHCSIGPDGNVILCPGAGKQIKITPGNCLEEDFKKIWMEGDVFKAVRQPNIPGCSTCEYKNCMGGCHVRTFHKYGKVGSGPDPECRKNFLKKYQA
ncbi:SPASM domain-containing protein [Ruminiclostridium herbifermentans]|nr:SPASM domain-containing protein [Ruminiclostridium herbifermentans]